MVRPDTNDRYRWLGTPDIRYLLSVNQEDQCSAGAEGLKTNEQLELYTPVGGVASKTRTTNTSNVNRSKFIIVTFEPTLSCLREGKGQECWDDKSSSHQRTEKSPIPPHTGTQSASNGLHMSHTGRVQAVTSQLTV